MASNPVNDATMTLVGVVLGASFALGIGVEFLLARLRNKPYVSSHYLVINLITAALQQVTDLLNKGLFLTAFVFVQTHYSLSTWLGWQVGTQAGIAQTVLNYVLVLVLADFCQYWLHRFSHEVNFMWAGHITHHSNEEYNLGVAVRQNALEGLYTWVFFMPLALLGIPWQLFVTAYAISLLWQFLVHTRFVNRLGVLELFMATPSHHRVHHGRNPQYIDKNYGALLIVWDKLFGTFEPEVEEPDYGITHPLNTHNPLWSNVHHFVAIGKGVVKAEGLGNKWKVLFGAPAFSAAYEDSEMVIAPQFTQQGGKKLYVFLQFVLTAGAGFWGLNYLAQSGEWFYYAMVVVGILFSFSLFTALLENKPWADVAEVCRLLFVAVAGFYLFYSEARVILGEAFLLTGVCCLMFTWLLARSYKLNYAEIK